MGVKPPGVEFVGDRVAIVLIRVMEPPKPPRVKGTPSSGSACVGVTNTADQPGADGKKCLGGPVGNTRLGADKGSRKRTSYTWS
jgi:hypothetical protein